MTLEECLQLEAEYEIYYDFEHISRDWYKALELKINCGLEGAERWKIKENFILIIKEIRDKDRKDRIDVKVDVPEYSRYLRSSAFLKLGIPEDFFGVISPHTYRGSPIFEGDNEEFYSICLNYVDPCDTLEIINAKIKWRANYLRSYVPTYLHEVQNKWRAVECPKRYLNEGLT